MGAAEDLAQIRTGWDTAARVDAYGHILTDRDGGWDRVSFFEHGRVEIGAAMARLDRLGLHPTGTALDFGCGVGRLTEALAEHFDRVVGVDVSRAMITKAVALSRSRRTEYVVNDSLDLAQFETDSFGFLYSMLVLQHLPRTIQSGYVREFVRVLDGVGMIEIPAGPDYGHAVSCLSMHPTDPGTVKGWISEAGGTVLDIDAICPGTDWDCNVFTFRS